MVGVTEIGLIARPTVSFIYAYMYVAGYDSLSTPVTAVNYLMQFEIDPYTYMSAINTCMRWPKTPSRILEGQV